MGQRYQPTQGPGEGLKLAHVGTTVFNAGAASVRGQVATLTASGAGSPPYDNATDVTNESAKNGLLCLLQDDAGAGDRVPVTVTGIGHGLIGAGGASLDEYLAANASGELIAATAGLRVVARCLEAGANGDVVRVDFDGDHGFGEVT